MEVLSPSNPMTGRCFTGSKIRKGLKRSHSVAFPAKSHDTSMPPLTPDRIETTLTQAWLLRNPATIFEPVTKTIRAPSPTPTEIDQPELEEHTTRLLAKGIKVRDYAYQPSSTSKPAVEVYDYQRVCAEYDFIMIRAPRDRPVPGKTLRRLLDLGFISKTEQNARWREMDWEELRRYDTKSSHYPSRGYPGNGIPVNGVPSLHMRTEWLKDFGNHLFLGERMMNRMQAQQIAAERRAEMWQADTERVMATCAAKRPETDGAPPESPKRARLSPSPDPSPHWLPPGYRHVQTQPSGSSLLHNTPPNPRGPSLGRKGLTRTTTFRQL